MEPITFEYQYGDDDFSAAAGYMARKMWRKVIVRLALVTVCVAILFALWLATSGSGFIFGLILGFESMLLMNLSLFKKNLSKAWKRNPQFQEKFKAQLSEQAITIQSPTLGSKRLWRNFQTFTELDDHFLLFQGEHPALWLPKRAFQGSVDQVRGLLTSKLPAKS